MHYSSHGCFYLTHSVHVVTCKNVLCEAYVYVRGYVCCVCTLNECHKVYEMLCRVIVRNSRSLIENFSTL